METMMSFAYKFVAEVLITYQLSFNFHIDLRHQGDTKMNKRNTAKYNFNLFSSFVSYSFIAVFIF